MSINTLNGFSLRVENKNPNAFTVTGPWAVEVVSFGYTFIAGTWSDILIRLNEVSHLLERTIEQPDIVITQEPPDVSVSTDDSYLILAVKDGFMVQYEGAGTKVLVASSWEKLFDELNQQWIVLNTEE